MIKIGARQTSWILFEFYACKEHTKLLSLSFHNNDDLNWSFIGHGQLYDSIKRIIFCQIIFISYVRPSSGNPRKTRHKSEGKISEYIGAGQDFLTSGVLTLRSSLKKILLLQEQCMLEEDGDRRNLPISSVMKEVADIVLTEWKKSNNKFIPSVIVTKDAGEIINRKIWASH